MWPSHKGLPMWSYVIIMVSLLPTELLLLVWFAAAVVWFMFYGYQIIWVDYGCYFRDEFCMPLIIAATNQTNNNNSVGNNGTIIITYDHIGNPLWLGHIDIKYIIRKVSVAWNNYGRILQLDFFILTHNPGYLFRRIQGNRRNFIGMRDQKRWITMQMHIVLEGKYGRYHLHQKSAQ